MNKDNKQPDGGPAFPQHGWSSNPDVVERMSGQGGMTLRDWFAGKALSAIVLDDWEYAKVATIAYKFADAMLAARESEATNGNG